MKGQLHPRNRHQGRYDFRALMKVCPDLAPYASQNHAADFTIDFANPKAVMLLNQALLESVYGIKGWSVPDTYLCPPIPGRADYLHYAADLISEKPGAKILEGDSVRVLDIGTGANLVYPLIGSSQYGWSFVGSDVDAGALKNAASILHKNPELEKRISLREQKNRQHFFNGIILAGEHFDFVMANPPFHASEAEANEVNQKKWRNLGKAAVSNFGGRNHELWCEGGEVSFILGMIRESFQYRDQVAWFTALVSKEVSLYPLYDELRKSKVLEWRTIAMEQGQKKSRFIAWRP